MDTTIGRQIGGTHYQTGGIQPIEFGHRNHYDPSAFSILKYVARHSKKNGVEDLRKARHFVELRIAFIDTCEVRQPTISMLEFSRSNNLSVDDSWALQRLEDWVLGTGEVEPLLASIDALISDYDCGQLSLLR